MTRVPVLESHERDKPHDQDRHRRRHRIHGRRAPAPARFAPGGRRPRDHVAQGRGDEGRRRCSRACAGAITHLAFSDPAQARSSTACDVVFFATPHGVAMAQARELVGAGVRIDRPRRRFPDQGRRGLREVVPDSACVPRAPRRGRLRTDRAQPRRRRVARASSGIPAAIRPSCSSDCGRCSKRGSSITEHLIADCKSGVSGAGPQGGDGAHLLGGLRQLQGVRRQRPSPPPGNRAGARHAPRAGRCRSCSSRTSCR